MKAGSWEASWGEWVPSDYFVIRRFRGKEIGSGDSGERDGSERFSGLLSIIVVP